MAGLLSGALLLAPIEAHTQRPAPGALRGAGHHDSSLIYPSPQRRNDPWFGRDKVRHLGASAAIQIIGFGVLRSARLGQRPALVLAGVTTLAAGVGKELHDRRSGGHPSVRDLAWDLTGLALGAALGFSADVR
jgi:putative lipoprotein